MTVYGTFHGFKNYRETLNKFKWNKVTDEMGKSLNGIYLSEIDPTLNKKILTFGNRYKLTFDSMADRELMTVTNIKKVNKNPRCDVFRKFKDEFHIISGKYKGKKSTDISDYDISMYCIWLARRTDNEATISNTLQILGKINGNSENK